MSPVAADAGDHASAVGDVPDGARIGLAGASASQGGEPMQTIRASAIALPFVALAVLVALLSALMGVAR